MVLIIAIAIYLIIGVAILVHAVTTDPWGGLLIEIWWLIVLFYPILIVWSLWQKFKR